MRKKLSESCAENTLINIHGNILGVIGRSALLCLFLWNAVHGGGIATAQAQTKVQKSYPFHEALRSQDLNVAKRLFLRHGRGLLTGTDSYGMSPLHAAASAGALESVRFLIDEGVDSNYKPDGGYSAKILGRTPLHVASTTENVEIVSLLLGTGADAFAQDISGATPLHLAVQYGRNTVASLLVKFMGKPHAEDKNGTTPLHIAARLGNYDLVERLLSVKNKGLRQRVENVLRSQFKNDTSQASADLSRLVNIQNNFGLSPLHYAALGGHEEVAKLLLEQGANINTFNAQGLTPLFLASRDGHEGIVEMISSHQEADLESGDEEAHTPLCVAVANGHLRIFSRLLRRGADPHAKDKNGMIPLHIATRRGNLNAVKILLKTLDRGNIDERDNKGNTPLLYAAQTGKKDLVEALLQAGAEVNVHNKNGESPLDVARRLEHVSLLPILR